MPEIVQLVPWDEHNQQLESNVHPRDWINPKPTGRYNLVVIGAGTAGLVTAAGAAKPLAEYKPQKRYLAILNLGDGIALSTWGPFWWSGRSGMYLKDFIDRRFLQGYRRYYSNMRKQ